MADHNGAKENGRTSIQLKVRTHRRLKRDRLVPGEDLDSVVNRALDALEMLRPVPARGLQVGPVSA